jgi:hypothetical protein
MDYEKILEDIIELDESGVVIVSGFGDLILNEFFDFKFKDLKEDNFYIKLGRADHSQVLKSLVEDEFVFDKDCVEGEYSFDMIFRWEKDEYYEHRLISPGYLELRYVKWKFIQTFEQRNREMRIDSLFDIDNLFGL